MLLPIPDDPLHTQTPNPQCRLELLRVILTALLPGLPATAVARIPGQVLDALMVFCLVKIKPVADGVPKVAVFSAPPRVTIKSPAFQDIAAVDLLAPTVIQDVSV